MRAVQKYVHGIEFLPSWRTPHSFLVFAESLRSGLEGAPDEELERLGQTRFAFTTGLLVHEVAAADVGTAEGVRALGERIGFEWLGQLASALREYGGRSELTKWLRRCCVGMPTPGLPPSAFVLGRRIPDAIPDDVLVGFAAAEQAQLERLQASIAPYADELVRAAKAAEAPNLDDRRRADLRGRPALRTASPVDTTAGWALRFGSLEHRLWWELFEVFEVRPHFHLCPLCERIYVPRTLAQKRCQSGLYAYPDGEPLRGCAPVLRLDADRHRREYKRRSEALRRAKKAHEAKRSEATAVKLAEAQGVFETYRYRNYGLAGRPSKTGRPAMIVRDPSERGDAAS